MPSDEIQCDQCRLILHYLEYSKSQRKQDDPICERCVAWNETQNHGQVPAPLATGHVSKEEETGEVWSGQVFMTDEDYANHMPAAPISGRPALGLDGDGPITDEQLQQMSDCTKALSVSETQSVASTKTTRLPPPHLRGRSGPPSQVTSDAASVSQASEAPQPQKKSVPPHLRKKAGPSRPPSTASVSTATTVREAREQSKQDRSQTFNAWDDQGNLLKKTHVPSTVASSDRASVGGSSYASSQRKTITSFPRPPEAPRPARQTDVNPKPPPDQGKKKTNFPKPEKKSDAPGPEEWHESQW